MTVRGNLYCTIAGCGHSNILMKCVQTILVVIKMILQLQLYTIASCLNVHLANHKTKCTISQHKKKLDVFHSIALPGFH